MGLGRLKCGAWTYMLGVPPLLFLSIRYLSVKTSVQRASCSSSENPAFVAEKNIVLVEKQVVELYA